MFLGMFFWCLVSGVWCLVSGVWCLVSGFTTNCHPATRVTPEQQAAASCGVV